MEIENDEITYGRQWVAFSGGEVSIRCCFKECEETFCQNFDDPIIGTKTVNAFYLFRQHFLSRHFLSEKQEVFSKTSGIMQRRQIPCPSVCEIDGCDTSVSDFDSYDRHLVFHMYHVELLYRGVCYYLAFDNLNSVVCTHFTGHPNKVCYDGYFLRCYWDNCESGFDDVNEFFVHVSAHVAECDEMAPNCLWQDCSMCFTTKKQVLQHLPRHTGEKCIACPFCGAFFANKTKFSDHIVRQSNTDECRLKCFLCNKVFSSKRLLREHSRRHINTHKCPYCDMTANGPHNLRVHIADRHSKVKPYKCQVCERAFARSSDMRRHTSKHSTTPTAYRCDVCNSSFVWKSALIAHSRKHKGPSYMCHLCTRQYTRGSSLSGHFLKMHKLSLPSGHCRFIYKKCADGYFRLQTERYESAGLTAEVESCSTVRQFTVHSSELVGFDPSHHPRLSPSSKNVTAESVCLT